jgi:antirestriction protein ArdC
MPPLQAFISERAAYSTLLHEVAHWTGAKHRLDRNLSNRFGNAAYAMEEMIAEIASAFLCSHLGVEQDIPDNASYIASWLDVLKSDKKAIVTAASKAQEIVDYVLKLNVEAKL